jgi:hypothetical protein
MSCMNPFLVHWIRRLFIILPVIIWGTNLLFDISISHSMDAQDEQKNSAKEDVFISQIAPDRRGGKAYKLTYFVKAPIDSYWKFKTDFKNDFLVNNKYIREHNFILQKGNTVITENKYTNSPDVYFRWQTTINPEAYRLEFDLLNPDQCKQKYHYGHIQLASVAEGTLVTQVAYFDFLGASLWAMYPWRGGMKDFLSYTARWEKETMLRLKDRYEDKK